MPYASVQKTETYVSFYHSSYTTTSSSRLVLEAKGAPIVHHKQRSNTLMAKNGTWERVEPQLYRLKHQTPTGEWTTRYYVRFRDWKGVNRRFPAGTDLRAARTKKRLLLGDNERRADFDKGKVQSLTFARWAERFLDLKKHRKSVSRYQTALKYLSPVFGPLPLERITRAKVEEYKNLRREQQCQYGRPPQDSTVNRELATL